MKFLDKLALNRLVVIITNFILSLVKLFSKNNTIDVPLPDVPDNKPFPWLRKKIKKAINNDE
jgi:hypothetical protein